MVDQTQPEIAHVQSKNKAINHDKQNTIKLNKVEIFIKIVMVLIIYQNI